MMATANTAGAGTSPAGNLHGAAAARFGHDVLGPIFAEFAQRLWMFQRFVPRQDDACLLFCARGGLRLRLIYETFLARTGLQAPLPYADLMISRLIAARTLIDSPSAALIEELGREFHGQTMADVVAALSQDTELARDPMWQRPFDATAFVAQLGQDIPAVVRLRAIVAGLDRAFRRHVEAISGGRSTVVLCDTGLYGSTVRLLRDGMPEKGWIATQFARSNYKGFSTPHFGKTIGLSVEREGYSPWNNRTTVLRFWHLIESVLEPDLSSVRTFTDDALPVSNLETPGWQAKVGDSVPGLFSGVLAHLDALIPADLLAVGPRADRAWRRLHRAVIWPRQRDLEALTLAPRARDFGRSEAVHQFPADGSIRSSLWREGAAIRRYPRLGRGVQLGLEMVHFGRMMRRRMRRRKAEAD